MAPGQEPKNPFEKPLSPCLVFGVAGRIGSGSSFVQHSLNKIIKTYGYTPEIVDVSKYFLEDQYDVSFENFRLDEGPSDAPGPDVETFEPLDKSSLLTRIKSLQRRGNHFRRRFGNNILAAFCIDRISRDLAESGALEDGSIRRAYIIDSLKHPAEVELLRDVFKGAFCMVGVVADDSVRKRRLQEQKHIQEKDFDDVSEVDADERLGHGQQTLNAILLADYFFANNFDIPGKIDSECQRLLNLLFSSDIVTPRQDEFGMNLAFMAADKSACLSRQVGAAIVTQTGTVLATGGNDVPQFGGGLYTSESKKDERCFARSGLCYNDDEKRIITEEILDLLRHEQIKNLTEDQLGQIKTILMRKTRLKTLIEFTRAVHAEMDAIISVARDGKPGIVGSTLYVTTYPCHNCAKHIIDAGIARVVFLEPYVKSLAQKLHSDAINNPLEQPSSEKISFDNYGGVSPRRYPEFFSMSVERKKESKFIRRSHFQESLLPISVIEIDTLRGNLDAFDRRFKSLPLRVPPRSITPDKAAVERSTDPADNNRT